ncbi:MAG TPA: SPFH domain-containing protein [Candidatus Dormibacteraeota bacterium]|nr:SPFH domain-containing protein [Candidatus Dormibacteraeota bacterium]
MNIGSFISTVAVAATVATLVVLLLLVLLFKSTWRIAEPNEALIISGRPHRNKGLEESLGFKIVTGRGTLVMPGLQAVRRLSLDLRETDLQIDCVTHQGIPLRVRGVVIYKVGDDLVSVANAARRFLDQQNQMDQRVHNLFAGHLRAIIGNMTVEEMIRDREKLTELTREHAGTEMEKLGLIVDSLQIQEILDPTGYIQNLALPHAAAVEREARIARAQADREATEKEQQAEAQKALARRDTQIRQAGYQAEVDQAAAQAKQAGPLSEATARQQVVVEETRVAELEAERKEKELLVEVRKPADAKAYEQVTLSRAQRDAHIQDAEARAKEIELQAAADAARVKLAAGAQAERVKVESEASSAQTRMIGEAEASATQARGRAEGEAIRARGMAEADAIKARAEALEGNQDAIIGQQLAEKWPEIVEAAAKPFGDIDQMIVLNGAQGISDALAQALSQGIAGLQLARRLLVDPNGVAPIPAAPAAEGERSPLARRDRSPRARTPNEADSV